MMATEAEILPWIDTHVHWDAAEFDRDRAEALARARLAGVTHCFNPGVTVAGISSIRRIAESASQRNDWPAVLPAYGIHPLYVESAADDDLALLDQQIVMHRPCAIGEIGLDGYTGAPDKDKQRNLFEAQLALAIRHQLPVLLHVRHAVEDVIQALKRVQGARQKIPGGIAHAFNGSESQAQQLIQMGFISCSKPMRRTWQLHGCTEAEMNRRNCRKSLRCLQICAAYRWKPCRFRHAPTLVGWRLAWPDRFEMVRAHTQIDSQKTV